MSGHPIIVWFTQDLRLSDNACLHAAVASGHPVLPVYILDDITPGEFAMGGASRWWLHQSLASLAASLQALGGRLIIRCGEAGSVLAQLVAETGAKAVYFSRGYAPWSGGLEKNIAAQCDAAGVECKRFSGFLLHEPEAIRTGSDGPYKVYTPFSRNCLSREISRQPRPAPGKVNFHTAEITGDTLDDLDLYAGNPDWAAGFSEHWSPGEVGAHQKLTHFLEQAVGDYDQARNLPDVPGTSRLSPHLHFGEISPLQCWAATSHAVATAGKNIDRGSHTFEKEILWREFSHHLLHYWPTLPTEPFKPEFADFPWLQDDEKLASWQKGQTGFPIVDAGMRELWTTGWMHNRVRMIVASFLIKNLRIPWQAGEHWFWDTLVDADIGANSASWQWVAGCGADAAPYFRIFNPVLQGEKFDRHAGYVRKWVPELAAMPDKFIHKPWQAPDDILRKARIKLGTTYPRPIVDLGQTRDAALAAYKTIRKPEVV
ncbi:FAD-binding domain-containing protein [Anderseniella sp. Alg231-50]|uniref:FAD-binding domain-containing protein n=1 Tax=Anderseniella sp. Alg231-50 TaxID=1922226 RepID=UPI000D552C43